MGIRSHLRYLYPIGEQVSEEPYWHVGTEIGPEKAPTAEKTGLWMIGEYANVRFWAIV